MVNFRSYLAKQLAGDIITTIFDGISQTFDSFAPGYLSYRTNINIDTAEEKDLEEIGKLIGFIRPLIPPDVVLETLFRFSSVTGAPTFSSIGLSSIDSSVQGGLLYGNGLVTGNIMPLPLYRTLLKAIARLKWDRFSFISIDKICHILSSGYTITYTATHDILITFTTSTISYANLYIASIIFDTTFDVLPRIICALEA